MRVENGGLHNIYLKKAPNIRHFQGNILKIFAKISYRCQEATFVSVEVVEVVGGDDGEGEEADHAAHQTEGQLVVQVAEQHRLHHHTLPRCSAAYISGGGLEAIIMLTG